MSLEACFVEQRRATRRRIRPSRAEYGGVIFSVYRDTQAPTFWACVRAPPQVCKQLRDYFDSHKYSMSYVESENTSTTRAILETLIVTWEEDLMQRGVDPQLNLFYSPDEEQKYLTLFSEILKQNRALVTLSPMRYRRNLSENT